MQLCSENSIQLPKFCYHTDLGIAGNCRICLVEEEAEDKMILACSTIVEEGDVIHTTSERILEARESVLEYLLVNHPLDCPICDRGGECDLQDQALMFGADRGRFYDLTKRAVQNKNYSTLIKFFLNRCIQCSRCTRFLADVSASHAVFLMGRGLNTEISSYTSTYISDEFSGNIIDLCPVGALTSKSLAFTLRFWEIIDIRSFDIFDIFLTPIKIELRGSSIMRILPTSSYNNPEYWISDKVRFNFDGYTKQRLLKPIFIFDYKLFYSTYSESLNILKKFLLGSVLGLHKKKIKNIKSLNKLGDFLYLEDIGALKAYSGFFGTPAEYNNNALTTCDYRNNFYSQADLDLTKYKSFFFIDVNTRLESPILNLKLKEFFFEEICSIYSAGVFSSHFDVDEFGGGNLFFRGKFLSESLQDTSLFVCGYGVTSLNNFFVIFFNYLKVFINNIGIELWNSFKSISVVNMLELGVFGKNSSLVYSSSSNLSSGLLNFVDFNSKNDSGNTKISQYILRLFCGTHGDYGAQISHIVFPVKIFLERAYSSVNIRGVCYSYRAAAYKYFVDDIKSYPELLKLKILKFNKTLRGFENYYFKDAGDLYVNLELYKYICRLSPLFRLTDTSNALLCSKLNEVKAFDYY